MPKKNPAKSAVFYWLFLGEVPPRNFPWNRLIFLRTCPWKSFKIWLFSAKIPQNRPIFLRILTFSHKYPAKSADFSANFDFFPVKLANFSANLPLKIPRNFSFFSAKYQKPCKSEFFKNDVLKQPTVLMLFNFVRSFSIRLRMHVR